ncbi:type II toxin-antitoxin system RelE/ParE family toxin [Acidithiobacillus sp.]
MRGLGGGMRGVSEIRIWDETGTYRVIYVAKFPEAVYVLHAFQKKTEKTAKGDLDLIRARLKGVAWR